MEVGFDVGVDVGMDVSVDVAKKSNEEVNAAELVDVVELVDVLKQQKQLSHQASPRKKNMVKKQPRKNKFVQKLK